MSLDDNITKISDIIRKDRIASIGAFGMKSEKVVADKTVYSRKNKHKKN